MSWGEADSSHVRSAAKHKAWVPLCEGAGLVLHGGGREGAGWRALARPRKMASPVLTGDHVRSQVRLRGHRGRELRVYSGNRSPSICLFRLRTRSTTKLAQKQIYWGLGGRCL